MPVDAVKTSSNCPCGRDLAYVECCGRLHQAMRVLYPSCTMDIAKVDDENTLHKKVLQAAIPEDIMRSRYSAYVLNNFDYVLQSYAKDIRATLNTTELAKHASDTKWRALEVIKSTGSSKQIEQVTFKVYYQIKADYYLMHERSNFINEDGVYLYQSGDMLDGTGRLDLGRNSPCPCQSGKKYKRCCA